MLCIFYTGVLTSFNFQYDFDFYLSKASKYKTTLLARDNTTLQGNPVVIDQLMVQFNTSIIVNVAN